MTPIPSPRSRIAGALASSLLVCVTPGVFTAKPVPPLTVTLSFRDPPRLGATSRLTCTVRARTPVASATLRIELPAAVEHVTGSLTWEGALKPDVQRVLELRVRLTDRGEYTIFARAEFFALGQRFGVRSEMNLVVEAEATRYGPEPFEVLRREGPRR